MTTFIRIWNAVETAIIGLLLLAALAISLYDMFARIFGPQYVTGWAGELTVYFVVWALFLANSALTYENRNVRADLVVQMLPLAGRRGAEIIHCLIGIAFGAVLLRYSFLAAYEAWDFGDLSNGSLRAPLWIFYSALPVGFALVILRYIHRLWLLGFRFTPKLPDHAESES